MNATTNTAVNMPAFDTHQAVKNLQQAGASEPLAEAMVAAIGTAVNDHLATKGDLDKHAAANTAAQEKHEAANNAAMEQVNRDLSKRMDRLEKRMDRLETRIDLLEHRLLIRLGVMMVALFGAFAFLV